MMLPLALIVMAISAPQVAASMPPPVVGAQEPQQPIQIPQTDIVVEVVGALPIHAQLQNVTRLLARRATDNRSNRIYPPIILDLLTLIERNPIKPSGRRWDSIGSVTLGYDAQARMVSASYCVENCSIDADSGAMHSRRKTVSYSAPESVVTARLKKKLDGLKKYADPIR